MICILGDIHFNSSKSFYRDICESFLEWYESWEYNNSNNTLILAGDLVESAANAGIVIDWLNRFLDYSNFKHIHICVGNHDKKIISDIPQLAYEFYRNSPKVSIYETATSVHIDGADVLFLPYYTGVNELGLTMRDFYMSLPKTTEYSKHYDLLVGHIGGPDALFEGSGDCIDNLDTFNVDRICLGHIHTRTADPGKYLGSIYACKKSENDNTRAAWVYNTKTKDWTEDPLPIFSEFVTVNYPEDIPPSNALHPVYTILSCSSKDLAIKKYGNIHIRKVTSADYDVTSSSTGNSQPSTSTRTLSIRELFEDFAKNQTPPLDKEVLNRCFSLLESSSTNAPLF